MKSGMPWWDNVSDHRAGTARTIDRPFQNHAQVGLRVHRIVIPRLAIGQVLKPTIGCLV